ncbi:ArsR/SmtB family transcription factor [Segeticoccus rhizosphaerae]|uniref:ArsR/SmtB family transcription factor n=1 Tax=Segeticoccus rhizosphaerae TaxID=1104777 RepID=UPI0010BF9133|nr:metalloregulator ArsR/SmtB family transcription factor [Ornithinicoccus soli]
MSEGQRVIGLDACTATQVDDARVAATRPLVVTAGESVQIADVFALLSDPSRVRILFALLEAGEMCVCDLAEMVQMSSSALSHALRLLRTAGVVTHRRDGRMMRYRLADSHVRLLLDVAREHLDHAPVPTGRRG